MSMGRELKDFVAAMNGGLTNMTRLGMEQARARHYQSMDDLYASIERKNESIADKNDRAGSKEVFDPSQGINDAQTRAAGGTPGQASQGGQGQGNPGMTLEADDLKDKDRLIDKIVQGESNGNYNAVYGGAKLDLSKMTIAQVQQYQQQMKRSLDSTAVGGPQFIQGTLNGLVHQSGVDPNTTYFTPQVQRQLASLQLDNRGFNAFQAGKISQGQFLDNVAHEWAAMPSSTGAGAYDGYNGNHVRVALGSSITQGTAPVTPVQSKPVGALPSQRQATPSSVASAQPAGTTWATMTPAQRQNANSHTVQPASQTPAQTPASPKAPANDAGTSAGVIPVADNSATPTQGDSAGIPQQAPMQLAMALPAQQPQEQTFATGGAVGYDDGGDVDPGADIDQNAADDDAEDMSDARMMTMIQPDAQSPQPQGAVPAGGSPAPLNAGPQTPNSPAPEVPQHVSAADTADAVHAGLGYIAQHYGLTGRGAVPTPQGDANVQRFHSNDGAPSQADMEAVRRAVDPDGKLTEGQRNMVILYQGWKSFNEHGDPNRAAAYAGQFLMAARAESQAAGERAQAALKAGDMGTAAKEIQKAYDTVPDGTQMQVGAPEKDGVPFRMLDENGQVTQQGKATMDQLMYITTGMKDGTAWFNAMAGAGSASSQAQRASQQRTAAAAAFDASRNPQQLSEFEKMLNSQQLQLFNQMSPQDKAARIQMFGQQQQAQVKAQNDQQFAQMYGTIRQAQTDLQTAIQKSGGQTDTDIVRAAQIKVHAAQDAAIQWAGADPGRAGYVKQLEGSLYGRGAATMTPTVAAPSSSSKGRMTQQEQEQAAIGKDEQGAISAAKQPLEGMSDADYADGGGQAVSQDIGIAKADAAFKQQMVGQGRMKNMSIYSRMQNGEGKGMQPLYDAIGKAFTGDAALPDDSAKRDIAANAAYKLMQGNQIGPDQAARVVKAAVAAGSKLTFTGNGRVRFGNSPPVYMDREGLMMMAQLRGSAGKSLGGDEPVKLDRSGFARGILTGEGFAAPGKGSSPSGATTTAPKASSGGYTSANDDSSSWTPYLNDEPSQALPVKGGVTGNPRETRPSAPALPITGRTGGSF